MKKILSALISAISMLMLTAVCFTCFAVSAPKTVSAVKYTSTASSVTLSWNNVKSTGYRVYKYNASTKKWVSVVTTTKTTATVKNLKAGSKTIFAVKPYNKQNDKIAWAKAYTKITTYTRPANATGLKTTSKTDSVTITWNKAAGATGYRIYLYNTSSKSWDILLKASSKTSVRVEGLKAGTSYIFAVKPYYNSGNGILWASKYTQIKTSSLPAKVSGVKISLDQSGNGTITWNKVNGAQRYYVYSYNENSGKYSLVGKTTKTSFAVSNLLPARRYYYAVRAARFIDSTTYSGALSSKVKTPLTAYRNFINSSSYANFYPIDINEDGIYELIASKKNIFSADVYTYNNNKVTFVGTFNCSDNKIYHNSDMNAVGGRTYGVGVFITDELYTIIGTGLKRIAHCSLASKYDSTTYTIDEYTNKVSKSAYDTYFKAYFKSVKTYTMYPVTSSNISKYL